MVYNPLLRVILNLIQPPRRTAIIMHRRPAQIPPVFALERATVGLVQSAPVVPDDHVRGLFPFYANGIVFPCDMVEQLLDQRVRFFLRYALDVVRVGCDIDVSPAAGFVHLNQLVACHPAGVRRVEVLEELGRAELSGLCDGMVHGVVLLQQLPLQGRVQVVPGRARVGKVSVAAVARWRNFHGAKKREAGSSGVE